MRYFLYALAVCLFGAGCARPASNVLTVVTPRDNFLSGTKINLIIFDLRPEKNPNVQLERVVQDYLTKTFPRAWFRPFEKNDYFREPNPGVVTLKIKIQEYDVAAHPVARLDVYNAQGNGSATPTSIINMAPTDNGAVMDMTVTIADRRNGYREIPTQITETAPVALRVNGSAAYDGMQIVLQRSLDRVANFMDFTLRY